MGMEINGRTTSWQAACLLPKYASLLPRIADNPGGNWSASPPPASSMAHKHSRSPSVLSGHGLPWPPSNCPRFLQKFHSPWVGLPCSTSGRWTKQSHRYCETSQRYPIWCVQVVQYRAQLEFPEPNPWIQGAKTMNIFVNLRSFPSHAVFGNAKIHKITSRNRG